MTSIFGTGTGPPATPPLAILAALALGAPGCERVRSEAKDRAERVMGNVAEELSRPHDAAVEDSPPLTEDQQLTRKLRLYVECQGRASQRIRDSWQRYDERIGDSGTLRKKATTPLVYTIDSELRPCERAVEQGPRLPPSLPEIERAMAGYLEHAQAFAELSAALDDYFEDEGYEQDDWERGKTLGPRFASAYAAWSAQAAILEREVETRQDDVDRRRLDQDEQRMGHRTLEWHSRNLVLHARAFMRCVRPSEATAQGCKDEHDALVQADAEFWRAHEREPAVAKGTFWMSAFRGSVKTFTTAAGEALEAPRRGPRPHPLTPSLTRAYDALISDSSNLRFER